MPDRLSFTKDYLGYYNGTSNATGLPITNHDKFLSASGVVLANRIPKFANAVTGSLTKINYPTGGSTSFDYEGIPVKEYIYATQYVSLYNKLALMNPAAYPIPDTQLNASQYFGAVATDPIYQDQDVVFKINATAQGNLNHNYKIRITVQGVEDIDEHMKTFDLDYGTFNYNKEVTFHLLKDYVYLVTAELVLPNGTNSRPVDVDIDFKYITGVRVTDGVGVRVKRMINDPVVGSNTIKRYYYNKMNDIDKTDNIPFKNDFYGVNIESLSYTKYVLKAATDASQISYPNPVYTVQYTLFSEPVSYILPDDQKTYQYVTTSFGGDNFENGGLQKTYRSRSAQNPTNVFNYYPPDQQNNSISFSGSSTENRDVFNGEVEEVLTFVKDNGILKLNKKSSSTFFDDTPDFIMNLNIKKVFDNHLGYTYDSPLETIQRIYHLYFGLYKTFVNKRQLQSQVTIDYIDAVPVTNLANAGSYKQVSTTTDYSYQPSLVGLPVRIQTTSSNDNILKTENQYSTDLKHINNHQLSEIATTSSYNNSDLLATTKNSYNYFGSYYLPYKVQTSKGSGALEDKINFLSYDDKGNPRELYKTDGAHIVYIWGYNKTKPIAKIENSTYGSIDSSLIIVAEAASDTGTEASLLTALANLRTSLPNSVITTYTYLPIIGVSTITDPKGYTTYYTYDISNRLQYIKDKDSNVLQKYCYNYLGQQTDCSSTGSTPVTTYTNSSKSASFAKQSCAPGSVGSTVLYSVPASIYSSFTSQADADNQADNEITANGQNFANANGVCTFSSASFTGNFTKSNCAAGGVGQVVSYTLAAGSKTSTDSQADADAQATILFNAQGQANANTTGICTFSSASITGNFTKNNCAAGGVGQVVSYTLAAGSATSSVSQAAADAQATILFNAQGQENANITGICTFSSTSITGNFTKNNCAAGGVGQLLSYTLGAGSKTSTVSQADANAQATTLFNVNGQNFANANGICTFYSVSKSGAFTKSCASNYVASTVIYNVPAGTYSSTISQVAADDLAQNDVNTNGQNYANNTGTCTLLPPVVPTGLTYISSTEASITFSWSAVVGAASYKIYKNGSDTGIISTTTSASLPGLNAATTYIIQVLAVNASGNSILSAGVSMNTKSSPVNKNYTLNFDGVAGNCTLYKNSHIYLQAYASGTSYKPVSAGETFYVRFSAPTTYYRFLTITSSVRGVLYSYGPTKGGSTVVISPTFTALDAESITVNCNVSDQLILLEEDLK